MRLFVFTIVICFVTLVFAPESGKSQKKNSKDIIILEATLLKLAPPVEPSGVIARYRLAKYKIDRVCRGKFADDETIVDHFILSGNEFDNVNIGDKVYIPVMKYKTLDPRYDSEGIRKSTDKVDTFYVGRFVYPAKLSNCSYDEREILNRKR